MSGIKLPGNYSAYKDEYDEALKLLVKSDSEPNDFCDTETMVERTKTEYDRIAGVFTAGPGPFVSQYSFNVEAAARILEANDRDDQAFALRELSFGYLSKTRGDFSIDKTLIGFFTKVGQRVVEETKSSSEAPYPVSYLCTLLHRQIQAHDLVYEGSTGGLVFCIILLVAAVVLLGTVWFYPPASDALLDSVYLIPIAAMTILYGVYIWRHANGCAAYIIASLLGGGFSSFVFHFDGDKQQEVGVFMGKLSITLIVVGAFCAYWFSSFKKNYRYVRYKDVAFDNYNEAKDKTWDYLGVLCDGAETLLRAIDDKSPERPKLYKTVTESFESKNTNGGFATWNVFTREVRAVVSYYRRAKDIYEMF